MRYVFKTKEEWLEYRKKRITATKVSAILGKSKYLTSSDVYELLVGIKEESIVENERMKKGSLAEEHIRQLFLIRHLGKYELIPIEKDNYVFFVDDTHNFIGSSCDGELIEVETGKEGVIEIKFFDGLLNSKEFTKETIREDCYIQVIHELGVTKKDFAVFIVALNYEDTMFLREYFIQKEDVQEDIDYVVKEVVDFYNKYVVTGKKPPLKIDI